MLPEVGTKEFTEYLILIARSSMPKRHKFYGDTVKHMKEMGVHMTGDNPKKLLDIKRPNEEKEAKEYRLEVYKPKTKAAGNKAATTINRIYNERLYSIEYKPEPTTLIKQEDGLRDYLTKEMPLYVSLMNFIKTVFTKMHLKDANGAIGVMPNSLVEDTEFTDPIPIFYTSEELVDFKDNEYFVFLDKDGMGSKVTIYDTEFVRIFERDKEGANFKMTIEERHDFGIVPAFRVRGVVIETEKPQWFESFIAGVLPHWDDAVCMFSDLQAVIVNHLYPDKWEFTVGCINHGCRNGKVNVENAAGDNTEIDCTVCHGSGRVSTKGPFNIYQVNRDAIVPDAPLPTPPFGYGEKELGSTELLEKLAEKEIDKGFAAINMEVVNQVPEVQSGVAKVIDRQDLDSFLDVYSSHIFNYILPNIISLIILWRYGKILTDAQMLEYFPAIKEPTTFDIFSISLLTQELEQLKAAGVSGSFVTGIQKDIIEKRFTDEQTKAFHKTIIDVDPLAHMSNDDILASGRVIGIEDMTMHAFAKDLIETAMTTDDNFLSKPLNEKKEIIRALAKSRQPEVIQVEPDE